MAVFVGDLIDRGPGQIATLNVVRSMVEGGFAQVVMGNHEFNAIGWLTRDARGPATHLRPHDEKNRRQHAAFLSEVGENSSVHREWIDWFWTLPLWLEHRAFRVVHACWSPRHLSHLTSLVGDGNRLTPELLRLASDKSHLAHEAIETVLKGVEINLPAGSSFRDKDGHVRHTIRTRWWDPTLTSYRAAYTGPPGVDIPETALPHYLQTPPSDRPVFIGHDWMSPDGPYEPLSTNVACIDYSVARGGPLVAYRFEGEITLTADHFVAVRS